MGKEAKMITYKGETKSIRQWSKVTGVPGGTISTRLLRGATVEEALTPTTAKEVQPDDLNSMAIAQAQIAMSVANRIKRNKAKINKRIDELAESGDIEKLFRMLEKTVQSAERAIKLAQPHTASSNEVAQISIVNVNNPPNDPIPLTVIKEDD